VEEFFVPPLDGASNEPPVDQAEHLGPDQEPNVEPPARSGLAAKLGRRLERSQSNQHIRFNRPRPDHSWVSGESAR
jgi:hypothetical protein